MTEGIEMQEEVLLWARYVDQQLMSRVCAHLVVVGPDDSIPESTEGREGYTRPFYTLDIITI